MMMMMMAIGSPPITWELNLACELCQVAGQPGVIAYLLEVCLQLRGVLALGQLLALAQHLHVAQLARQLLLASLPTIQTVTTTEQSNHKNNNILICIKILYFGFQIKCLRLVCRLT